MWVTEPDQLSLTGVAEAFHAQFFCFRDVRGWGRGSILLYEKEQFSGTQGRQAYSCM